MSALIGINHYYSLKSQTLRDLPIYVASIVAVKAGSKRLKWHDKTLCFNRNNWLIVPANQRLTFINDPATSRLESSQFRSTQVTFLAPPPKAMMDLITNNPSDRVFPPQLTHTPKLDFAFTQLQAMVNYNFSPQVQQHYLNGFYQLLLEAGALQLLFPSSASSSSEKISRYLSGNPADPHCIDDLCKHFAISKSTLCRRLAKENRSFRDILTEVRMLHALTLMQQRFHQQPDLAMRCGYQSETRFGQRFQQQFGITPKQYQQTLHLDC